MHAEYLQNIQLPHEGSSEDWAFLLSEIICRFIQRTWRGLIGSRRALLLGSLVMLRLKALIWSKSKKAIPASSIQGCFFMYQQVLNLSKYTLIGTTAHDKLCYLIIHLTKTKLESRSGMWKTRLPDAANHMHLINCSLKRVTTAKRLEIWAVCSGAFKEE